MSPLPFSSGDLDAAAVIMEKISALVTMLEVTQRRINLARRSGRLDAAEAMYAEALKVTQHRETAVVVAIKFVRFLYKVCWDRVEKSRFFKHLVNILFLTYFAALAVYRVNSASYLFLASFSVYISVSN